MRGCRGLRTTGEHLGQKDKGLANRDHRKNAARTERDKVNDVGKKLFELRDGVVIQMVIVVLGGDMSALSLPATRKRTHMRDDYRMNVWQVMDRARRVQKASRASELRGSGSGREYRISEDVHGAFLAAEGNSQKYRRMSQPSGVHGAWLERFSIKVWVLDLDAPGFTVVDGFFPADGPCKFTPCGRSGRFRPGVLKGRSAVVGPVGRAVTWVLIGDSRYCGQHLLEHRGKIHKTLR